MSFRKNCFRRFINQPSTVGCKDAAFRDLAMAVRSDMRVMDGATFRSASALLPALLSGLLLLMRP